ncbi:hypothetical protein [Lederbergia lenta]|uniref:hypothetical protein n=1 Tax=Lederbergia lenta TaxID=1467 RepID=UPI002040A9EA|nr:hypothetical protein [Lederbergia lenta]MCM3109937.1 hypothetical protein [Lederbergia lenta]
MDKPTKSYISFYRREGSYNFLNSKDVSAQYVITGIDKEIIKDKDLTISFIVDIEHDYEFDPNEYEVLDLLLELEHIYENKYWINSRLKDISPLREYLESVEVDQEQLRHKYEVDYAKYQIDFWTKKLKELQ